MTAEELIPLAADLGALLLQSGAEIRQVEDALYDTFTAHQIKSECFVLLKGIFLTAWNSENQPVTQIRHVRDLRGVDLVCLEKALALNKDLAKGAFTAREIRARIATLEHRPEPRIVVLLAAAAATAGIYALFFGGSWVDAACACLLAILAQALRSFLNKWKIPTLVVVFLASAFIGLGGVLGSIFIPGAKTAGIITGGIMILIPGVALVNGLKDILHGDTISSLYRLADVLLQTAAIAAGITLMLTLGGFYAHT